MWKKALGLAVCALGAGACGSAPPPPPKPAPAPPTTVSAPVAPAPRYASAELRRYWIFDDGRQLGLYAGLDTLLHSELFAGLIPGILGQTDDLLKSTQRDCVNALVGHARELSVGADARGALATLELGPEGVKAARSACVGSMFPVERVSVVGADEAYASGGAVVAVQPGVVLIGEKPLVEAALAGKAPAAFPQALHLEGDQELVFQLSLPKEGVSANGALRVAPERFRIEADVELPSEALADQAEQQLDAGRQQAKGFAQVQTAVPVGKLLDALKVERHGKHFAASFELREPVADQARDLGVLAGLSFYGARRYLQSAKSAEARVVLAQIAKSYAASLAALAASHHPVKKLVSLPAVPAAVPRGVKYQTATNDWKPWALIHFGLTEPQYYQYEVVAAKDGKTAEILARGDLDGNGVTSLFRIKIQLDPKTAQITAVEHTEAAPLE